MEKRIGFIGVGLMGYGPARLLLEAGYPLTLLGHRNRAPVDDLVGRGAQEAETAAELTRNVDVVITCVSSSAIMEKLVHGDDGIAAGAREGQENMKQHRNRSRDAALFHRSATETGEFHELGYRQGEMETGRRQRQVEMGRADGRRPATDRRRP
ncbi:hypothetical protein CCR87_07540 [Rhodobaculum claviforme]|uniref:6-phosphogluconate dehydrogenase NADP-binding domain-containing protein n=1 Tax=Rhodobaculum claviforme TaxID=1549854 RepID=A0A934WJ61_9RHOB|nr:hypothetical protein [Rhodobaculum claviforme]